MNKMEQKHTPGPWYVNDFSGYHNLYDKPDYNANNLLDEDQCARAPHNAKLAAAAPELLDALQELIEVATEYYKMVFDRDVPADHYAISNALEAIKKATE
ncbi:hypothetical protein [Pontibacter sp. SGAir0037]|uniref:hypothetical protein n=1 Tax=Pontibacter sp. SGAir0037 TaxID=2571030 RepID=UPI0010CD2114|nr:hypothetical protein [Pontibacter sp. SGAir0037]QCR23102.1 hypothetical protein C1N53_12590 [Pontibacter sp. SGAir0037]